MEELENEIKRRAEMIASGDDSYDAMKGIEEAYANALAAGVSADTPEMKTVFDASDFSGDMKDVMIIAAVAYGGAELEPWKTVLPQEITAENIKRIVSNTETGQYGFGFEDSTGEFTGVTPENIDELLAMRGIE